MVKFEIGFNRNEEKEEDLIKVGAFLETRDFENGDSYTAYYININDFEELEELENKLYKMYNKYYSMIVGFDPATIYLTNNI